MKKEIKWHSITSASIETDRRSLVKEKMKEVIENEC